MSADDKTNENAAPEDGTPQAANENESRASTAYVDERITLEAQVAELKDKYLRAYAETENTRRRAERDVADARAYSIAGFARDMLSVADNLGRALEAVDPAAREAAEGTLRALLDGVDLTARDLLKALEKHGVKKLEPTGQKFDPNFHQAMFEVPDETVPAGTVVQVVQPGYGIGDRVLRPAWSGSQKAAPRPHPPMAAKSTAPSDSNPERAC
jgi:molecular chaperone GrpE